MCEVDFFIFNEEYRESINQGICGSYCLYFRQGKANVWKIYCVCYVMCVILSNFYQFNFILFKISSAEDTGWWTSRSTVLWRETAEQIGKRRRSTKKRKNTEEGKKKDRKEQERGKRS